MARPDHAFIARPATHLDSKLQVIGPEELAAELREEVPDSQDPVKQALLNSENINFDRLYTTLKDANADTLLTVTKRAISTGQFLPRWFLHRYLEVDGAGCVRALLSGGRAGEAGAAWCALARASLATLQPRGPPAMAHLSLADLLLAELADHQQPYAKQLRPRM